jgi:SIR2-like domain
VDKTAWETLVESIVAGSCTPFLGAGVAIPQLPSGGTLARDLAKRHDYPLKDDENLARVAQYLATTHQPDFARRAVRDRIQEGQDRHDADHPSEVPTNFVRLAALNLPIYITTNYDDFMARAVRARIQKSARVEICRWHDRLIESLGKYRRDEPVNTDPLIFHLHGHVQTPESLLVTEDDYIDFMVSLANRGPKDVPVLPHWVRRALARTSLLFIGYGLEDWNFRVLMRHLMKQQKVQQSDQAFSLSIQLPPDADFAAPEQREQAKEFLSKYLGTTSIHVHWVTAVDFLAELDRRVTEARESRTREQAHALAD